MTHIYSDVKPLFTGVIEHSGVKGMKWGVRKQEDNSPNKLGSSTKLGSNEVAPIIGLGATYAAIGLAIYGKYVVDSGKITQIKNKDVPWKVDPSLAKKMSVDDLHKKVVAPINPGYGARGTKMNCRRCTFAYEMRRRGLDVKATPSDIAAGQTIKGVRKATKTPDKTLFGSVWGEKYISSPRDFESFSGQQKSKLVFDALGKNPNGARGELGAAWTMGGGHSLAWEIVRGKPIVFDTQSGVVYKDPKSFTKFASTVSIAAYTRLDNKPLDDYFLKKWAVNT